jgi:phage gpG-like protein
MIKVELSDADLKKAISAVSAFALKKRADIIEQVALSALKIEKDAKLAVPVDTGRLRSSIAVDFSNDRLGAEVGTNVEYSKDVEFGGGGRMPKPFLFPAAEAERQNFVAKLKQILSR